MARMGSGARAKQASQLMVEDRGPVRVLTISNPVRRNALSFAMLGALREALERAAQDGVRCLLLRGEGDRAFSSGMDLHDVHGDKPESGKGTFPAIERSMQAVEAAPPVVAYLNGVAYGAGCELACACDLRVARSGIDLCVTPTRLGLVYEARGIARVAGVVGWARARRMFLTAGAVDAQTALGWGLVDEVLPKRSAFEGALELAGQIARNAPLALAGIKRTFALMRRATLEPAAQAELKALQDQAFASEDAQEAMRAFVERRKPVFKGR